MTRSPPVPRFFPNLVPNGEGSNGCALNSRLLTTSATATSRRGRVSVSFTSPRFLALPRTNFKSKPVEEGVTLRALSVASALSYALVCNRWPTMLTGSSTALPCQSLFVTVVPTAAAREKRRF